MCLHNLGTPMTSMEASAAGRSEGAVRTTPTRQKEGTAKAPGGTLAVPVSIPIVHLRNERLADGTALVDGIEKVHGLRLQRRVAAVEHAVDRLLIHGRQ